MSGALLDTSHSIGEKIVDGMQYMLNFMSETLNMDITAFQQQFFSDAMRGINSKAPETDLF